jgi:hypothetical protein
LGTLAPLSMRIRLKRMPDEKDVVGVATRKVKAQTPTVYVA